MNGTLHLNFANFHTIKRLPGWFLSFCFLFSALCLQAQDTLYVKADATGTNNGTSWADAYTDLQDALTAAIPGDQIWVAAGTYKPTLDPFGNVTPTNPRDKTFYVKDGISIYGGFEGTEAMLSVRDIATNTTTLSGDIGTPNVNSDNCYHVILAAGSIGVVIDGFTVTGGNANGFSSIVVNGINMRQDEGGGININRGTNILTNNTLSGNSAGFGGGILIFLGTANLTNNILSGNSAILRGGGIQTLNGTYTLTNNIITGNTANEGGGFYTLSSTNTLTNNTLSGNSANNGGGIFTNSGTNILTNNIFWDNLQGTANDVQGADYFSAGTNGNTFKNNLLQLASSNYPVSATGSYAIGTGASGNIFAQDPLFVDAANGNFMLQTGSPWLQTGSPCIFAGDNAAWAATGLTMDAAGNKRPVGFVDIGAFESQSACESLARAQGDVIPPLCNGSDNGSVSVVVTGGTPPYSYSWDDESMNTDSIRTGLEAGTYKVYIEDTTGCLDSLTFMLGQPSALAINLIEPTNETCSGANDGQIAIPGATGGISPYEYSIDNGATYQSSATFTGLTADMYQVRIQDANGCESDAEVVTIGSPTCPAIGLLTWTGAADTDWDNPCNWDAFCVPTTDNDVVIPNVANAPVIIDGTVAAAKSVVIQGGAMLTINTMGSLAINGSTGIALENFGTLDNSGNIIVGNTTAIGTEGIVNQSGGMFNNKTGGYIIIDRTGSHAVALSGGTFDNASTLQIGSNAAVNGFGIQVGAGTFNNNLDGDISINWASSIFIIDGATFNNSAIFNIGNIAFSGQDNIINRGTFTNTATGEISLDRAFGNGIWNLAGTFQNDGKISVGSIANTGTGILSNVPFTNNAGAEIHIDRTTTGIVSTNAFTNAGLIRMGENAPLTGNGIVNAGAAAVLNNNAGGDISIKQTAVAGVQNDASSTFNNNACATLSIFDNLNNAGTFTNSGLFTVNTTQTHTNSVLTNNGIIVYPLGNPIPNVTNNEIIIAPTTANDCGPVSPAFSLGSSVDFTIVGIFTDEAATMSAGSYVTSTNTFTPSPILPEGTYTLYVQIEDSNGGCTRVLPWQLTVEDNTPPSFDCPNDQDVNLNENCQIVVPDLIGSLTGIDNCGMVTFTQSPAANELINAEHNGTTSVTITADDGNGNTAMCMVTLTGKDMTLPTITCPTNISVSTDPGQCDAVVVYSAPVGEDNCSGAVTLQLEGPVSGGTFSVGMTSMMYEVTDLAGNSANCSFTVTVTDNELPVVDCFDQTINFNGETTIPLNPDDLVESTDNCGVGSTVLSPNSISSNQIGQTVPVLVTVTDINNNSSTCTSQITVGGLPSGWSQQANGIGCAGGNDIDYNATTQVWTATSTNCYYSSPFTMDATAFAQRTLCGNGSITAQVTGISGTSLGWAGVVMRESNDSGAKKAQLMTNMSNFSRREFRTMTNGSAFPQQFPSQSRRWLHIVRTGNQFVMYISPNGISWTFAGAQNIQMNSCIEIGLVATNYNANSTVTATFANVAFTGNGPMQYPLQTDNGIIAANAQYQADFSVFPNPTSGELNVSFVGYEGRSVTIEVYSTMGQLLYTQRVDTVRNLDEVLDLSRFTNGMYLIRVDSDGMPGDVKRVTLAR